MIGKTIANYEIIDMLGKGGMGEVFRARDTKLDRDVALKLLPLDFAADPERLARFRREAKLLASLNHTNIAAIYGLEEADGKSFLVMELAEGEDLADRLRRGPIPLDEALEISRQIAEGLEEAHEKGIVHRDLKPGNIRLGPDGKIKILDFGLARAFVGEAVDEQDLHNSPTITAAMTQQGVILGTAAYMSPEQAKGKTVDRRADLWSFGVVLWEMLTADRLFSGETVSDTLAAVLRADPPYDDLPEGTPPAVRRLLERCLERDPRKRLRDVGEARVRLERWKNDPASLMESSTSTLALPDESRVRTWLPWGVATLAVILALGIWFAKGEKAPAPAPTLALEIDLQYQDQLQTDVATNVFLSPDGTSMAYIAQNRIHLRRMDQRETRTLDGTLDARIASFSPDGQWIAFTSQGKLKRISVTGGSPVEICDAPDSRGICWVDESTLVFNPTFGGPLEVVSLSDGIARPLTELDAEAGERSHRWPQALPGGSSVIFLCQYVGRDYDESDIMIVDLESKERRVAYRGGASPRYVDSGHLLFARDKSIFAIPMDPKKGITSGLATPVLDRVWTSVGDQEACDGSAQFDVSSTGLLIYRQALQQDLKSQLAWVDLVTGEFESIGTEAVQNAPLLSPDEKRLAVMRGAVGDESIYIINLENGIENRLTFEEGGDALGCWSPDSRQIFFTRPTEDGLYVVYRKSADGSGMEEEVTGMRTTVVPNSISPDGRWLYLTVWGGASMWDIYRFDLENRDAGSEPLISGSEAQYGPSISPDGNWLVYHQSIGETWHLYARRVEDAGGRWEVSQSNSNYEHVAWSSDGRTLYSRTGDGFVSIALSFDGGALQARPARLIQRDTFDRGVQYTSSTTVADGSRGIVMMSDQGAQPGSAPSDAPVILVTNWFDELKRKAPLKP